MKKIGIVGGLGWRPTVDYYAGICRLAEDWHSQEGEGAYAVIPEISIESLDLATAVGFLRRGEQEGDWNSFDCYHREALKRLQSQAADFGLIASNTPHHRFDEITSGLEMPVLNIFEVAASRARAAAITDVMILGTSLTMSSAQIRTAFERQGIKASVPSHSLFPRIAELIACLQRGECEGSEQRLREIAEKAPSGTGVCLACTELGLALPARSFLVCSEGITYLDPTVAHIEAAFLTALATGETDLSGGDKPAAMATPCHADTSA